MMHRLGDGPIEPRVRLLMNAIAAAFDEMLNADKAAPNARGVKDEREWGFVLLVFPFNGSDGRCNYISNGADRKDIIVLMKEMIARFEGQPDIKGTA
jgi:hypothetical protein